MSRSAGWLGRFCVLALVVLLALAACGQQVTAPRAAPTPTNGQDLIPSPTPTTAPTFTPTALPSPTARPVPSATLKPTATPAPNIPAAPLVSGRVILVSLSRQQLYAYENGSLAFTFTVETGRPELPTPTGVFRVFLKNCSDVRWTSNSGPTTYHNANCVEHNGDGHQAVFTSPWPKGSPNWYAPTHINYALEFKDGGFYLHDAWWHVAFGPGANTPHQLPNGTWETGSHGCIGMRILDASRLYAWTAIGTPVYVRANV
ncbi:MAG TPA: L,D-transpeptidase [Ktedonobacterales bacterium]